MLTRAHFMIGAMLKVKLTVTRKTLKSRPLFEKSLKNRGKHTLSGASNKAF
jgi:hypothetical protein